jgi:hypothetical protein
MIVKIINFTIKLHFILGWSGAAMGSYEHTMNKNRLFSNTNDSFYDASARGLIRGLLYPYNTCKSIPNILKSELQRR